MSEQRDRELVSRREFARRQGWAPSYVVKLCRHGQITTWIECPRCGEVVRARAASCSCGAQIAGAVDERKARIDAATALAELEAARDPGKQYTRERWAAARREDAQGAEASDLRARMAEASDLRLGTEADGDGQGDQGPVVSYADAKTRRETAEARLKELELARRRGELVERAAVEREAYRQARRLRDALLTLPDRLAQALAVETAPDRIHEVLDRELRQALAQLATDDDAVGSCAG